MPVALQKGHRIFCLESSPPLAGGPIPVWGTDGMGIGINKTSTVIRLLALALALWLGACQQGSGRKKPELDSGPIENPDFSDYTPIDDGPSTGGIPSGSSGTGAGTSLSDADKAALNAALGAAKKLEPQTDDGLSAALQAEAKRLLAEEAEGRDVAMKKMLLAGKMLEECAKRAAAKAPIPGQPLLGSWNGGGICGVSFEVSGEGAKGQYKVAGGTAGILQADTAGHGAVQASPFAGNVSDSAQNGKSGAGTLTHPTFHRSKAGTAPCSVGVALATPKSPIPQNYVEGMKILGKCFRQTLILMSPVMDRMFKNMDPQLAQLLQTRFLGIQK